MIIITFIYTLTRVNPYWPSQPMTQALSQSTPELDFKNMIIIVFLSLHGLGSTRVDPPNLWPESYLGLTLKSSFKIMIITTFILFWLGSTQIYSPDTWPEPYSRSTTESGFKTMIIIIFIFKLTWVNQTYNPSFALDWSPSWVSKLW